MGSLNQECIDSACVALSIIRCDSLSLEFVLMHQLVLFQVHLAFTKGSFGLSDIVTNVVAG